MSKSKKNQKNKSEGKQVVAEDANLSEKNNEKKRPEYLDYIEIAMMIGFFYILYLDYLSIEDCVGGDFNKCGRFVADLVKKYMSQYMLTGFIYAMMVVMKIYKVMTIDVFIFNTALFLYVVFFYVNVISITHYGGAVTKLIGLGAVVSLMGIGLVFLIFKGLIKKKRLTLITLVISAAAVIQLLKSSCLGWKKGLFGGELDQKGPYCYIIEPQICPLSIFERIINLTPLLVPENCENTGVNPEVYFQNFPNVNRTQKYIGFENTVNFLPNQRVSDPNFGFHKTLKRLAKSYETEEEAFGNGARETILDLTKMEYKHRLVRNETKVQQRLQNAEFTPFTQHILFIFMDAVARSQFHRLLPQTAAWFQKRQNTQRGTSHEYYRLYSMLPWTYPNFIRYTYETWAKHGRWTQPPKDSEVSFPCAAPGENLHMLNFSLQGEDRSLSNHIDFNKYDPECVEKNRDFDNKRRFHWIERPKN